MLFNISESNKYRIKRIKQIQNKKVFNFRTVQAPSNGINTNVSTLTRPSHHTFTKHQNLKNLRQITFSNLIYSRSQILPTFVDYETLKIILYALKFSTHILHTFMTYTFIRKNIFTCERKHMKPYILLE